MACPRVRPLGGHAQLGPLAGGQHHQSHDALAVDLLTVLFHPDFRLVAVGNLDETRRRPGVHPQLVEDDEVFAALLSRNVGVAVGGGAAEEAHRAFLRCIRLTRRWLNSSELCWPWLLSFWSSAATSTSRAMSRPGPDGDRDVRDLDVQDAIDLLFKPTLSTSSMSCQSFNVTTKSSRFSVRMLPMPKIAATLMTPSPRTSMW